MLRLHTLPNDVLVLRTACDPVGQIIPYSLITGMFELMSKSKGIGLAAPQVGVSLRLFVTAWGDVFINPEIEEQTTDACIGPEGCLSIPGKQVRVCRSSQVVVGGKRYYDLQARVIQHEIDHLKGILITDRERT
jgi:N-formylmethionyl-tRNA deformylase